MTDNISFEEFDSRAADDDRSILLDFGNVWVDFVEGDKSAGEVIFDGVFVPIVS